MKRTYVTPDAEGITLALRTGILIVASNEGYPVDNTDPGFVMEPDFTPNF